MKIGQILPYALLLISGVLFGLTWNIKSIDAPEKETQQIIKPTQVPIHNHFESESLSALEESTINLFESSAQSVVYITTSTLSRNYYSRNLTEMPSGSGSGFIWDNQGHIVTNYHVIKDASKAVVTLHDQTSYEASVVGVAPNKDLAVLKIEAPIERLIPLGVGSSDNLKVGQSVFAIGNPFGLDYTMTTGIISALGREINSVSDIKIRDVIQTDAAINPGNSGGPLLNSSGDLIGVNTAIYSPSGAYAGIGFSIPVEIVTYVVPDLIEYGYVKKPVLGVSLLPANQNRGRFDGALIMNVIPGKGADKAGLIGTTRDQQGRLMLGDIIIKLGEENISNNSDLILALENYEIGNKVDVVFTRQGKELKTEIILSEN